LLAAAEDWARPQAAPGALVRAFPPERLRELHVALERRGFHLVRRSFHMGIDLEGHLVPPEWPSGIDVRTYDHERDELEVYECVQEAFEDHWDSHRYPLEEWRRFNFGAPRFDPELWWLAWAGRELAGVSLNAWHFSGDPRYGHVGVLAVRRPWRRRGLGLALLRHTFADFAARGANRVGLGVDGENLTGAVRLYARAGMSVVRRNDIYEKELTS
jgi:mycothiol synthase